MILTFLPVYLVTELHFTAEALGVYIFLLHVVGIFSQTPLGYMSEPLRSKTGAGPVAGGFGPSCTCSLPRLPPVTPLTLVIIAIGTFFYTLMNVMTAVISDVFGRQRAGIVPGADHGDRQVAVLPTPIIAGYLVDHYGYGFAFVLAGVCVLLSAACLMPLKLYPGDR